MRVKSCDYRELHGRIADGMTLRQFMLLLDVVRVHTRLVRRLAKARSCGASSVFAIAPARRTGASMRFNA